MSWTSWFSGTSSDGRSDKASFKSSRDEDGNHKSERISRDDGESKHEHSVSLSEATGKGHTENWHGANFQK
ncbi:MAG: hypothetical protein A2541_02205 [Candidatus Taylorbacteria bacterium RIFOXYD2_FULL_36_9]|uniref:Uncharacterized protein n=1 Tax=Candidatus Taylorbacteria bacterium RIFOXYD2_FULL_36_9 TaxID=1802338 RepID=A0A1G2PGV7_9BACT|nr:MAG: hypothetical protein A2541_02205 [Candidatus Taylorbacteria bacterium RIFOXYD2_FULL_36_9]